jgi:hypothetical protein
MRQLLAPAFIALASIAIAYPARACGFEDPNGAPAQRVMLNIIYPKALYTLGAADTALRAGLLRRDHLTTPGDPAAFHRTTSNLRLFSRSLSDVGQSDLTAFSMVLMGPVLWTRFRTASNGYVTDIHTNGPLAAGAVIVTDVPAIAALVSGDISGADADASGLVRFYGDSTDIDILRKTLALAFPADRGQQRRARTQKVLPSFR